MLYEVITLYIKTLTQGIFETEPVNETVRERLKQEAEALGTAILHERLRTCDPEAADRLHPNDTYRIVRALEIFETTGQPISEYHKRHRFGDSPFETLRIGLCMDREKLYDRINRRVDIMIDAGLEAEVRELLARGYSPELKSMQSLGYRHMSDYVQGRLDMYEAVHTLKRDTRHSYNFV